MFRTGRGSSSPPACPSSASMSCALYGVPVVLGKFWPDIPALRYRGAGVTPQDSYSYAVVQLADPVEAAVAAGDDRDFRIRHMARPVAGLRRRDEGAACAGDLEDRHGGRVGTDRGNRGWCYDFCLPLRSG